MSAPVRLLDAPDSPEAERALLEAGRSHPPVGYDVDAGAARFRASLAGVAVAGLAAAGAEAVKSAGAKTLLGSALAKVLLGVAVGSAFVGVGMVAGVMMARQAASPAAAIAIAPAAPQSAAVKAPALTLRPPPSVASEAPTIVAATAATSGSPSRPRVRPSPTRHDPAWPSTADDLSSASPTSNAFSTASATVSTGSITSSTAASTASPAPSPAMATSPTPTPTTSAVTPRPTTTAAPPPLGEIQAIALARSLVARDPSAALGVLDRLRRDHPRGYFVEEREALTVLALAGDGQQALAKEQATAFLRAYPNGPFSEQVRDVQSR